MFQKLSDAYNSAPKNVEDELQKHRESIPPEERCLACDGCGMIVDSFLRTYRVCQQCNGSGRDRSPKERHT